MNDETRTKLLRIESFADKILAKIIELPMPATSILVLISIAAIVYTAWDLVK